MKLKFLKYKILKNITIGKTKKHYKEKYKKIKQLNTKYPINGTNNQLILVDDIQEEYVEFKLINNLTLKVDGSNNVLKINKNDLLEGTLNINIDFKGNNNICTFSKKVRGNWNITCYGDNNLFKVGENTSCGEFSIALHSNHFEIGDNCMISSSEELWTDGHSVLDYETREVINIPKTPIIIGNHVWLGRRCTLTKGAQIPDDCIVGIGSVITKKFTEPHCIIAGNPAKIVKTGVTWDGRRPLTYQNEIEKE